MVKHICSKQQNKTNIIYSLKRNILHSNVNKENGVKFAEWKSTQITNNFDTIVFIQHHSHKITTDKSGSTCN